MQIIHFNTLLYLMQGDSGGPLVVHPNIVVGVASTTRGCSERKYPGKYTRVSSFVPFINNVGE